MSEAVVFQSSVESLKRLSAGRLSPETLAKLRGLGFDFDRPLLTAYPLGNWEDATELVIAELYSGLALPEARAEMGADFMKAFAQTTIGKAMVVLARAIGVRRTLSRMTRNMRNGNNYTETELVDVGPGHVRLKTRMRAEYLDAWRGKRSPLIEQFTGVLREAMRLLDAKDASVTLVEHDVALREAAFDVRWKE